MTKINWQILSRRATIDISSFCEIQRNSLSCHALSIAMIVQFLILRKIAPIILMGCSWIGWFGIISINKAWLFSFNTSIAIIIIDQTNSPMKCGFSTLDVVQKHIQNSHYSTTHHHRCCCLLCVHRCCQFQFQTHLIIDLLNGVYPSNCWSDASCSSCTFLLLYIPVFTLRLFCFTQKSAFHSSSGFLHKNCNRRARHTITSAGDLVRVGTFFPYYGFFVDFWNIYQLVNAKWFRRLFYFFLIYSRALSLFPLNSIYSFLFT